MANVLIGAAMWLGILCAAAILIGALLRFSQWAVSETLATIWLAIRSIAALVAFASRRLAMAMQMATRFVVRAIWRALLKAVHIAGLWTLSLLYARARRRASSATEPDQDCSEARDPGTSGDAEGEPEQQGPANEAPDEEAAQAEIEQREYERALDLLGLKGVERLTRIDLKRRHGELMSILHPDKGFPNEQFAQQINEAVAIVKRHHNWR